MTDKVITDKELHEQIKSFILKHIGSADPDLNDRQKIIDACKSALARVSNQNSCTVTSAKVIEDTEEERLVREVMEEPNTDIRIEATVQANPIPVTHIDISFDTSILPPWDGNLPKI